MISQSFASKCGTYGYGTTNKPSQKIFITDSLKEIQKRLSNTFIENLSFENILEKYDRAHTFFFCDPPYYETDGYEVKFGEREHLLLRDILKDIKGKFLLTINDHPKVKEWYKGFGIKEVDVFYSVSKETKGRKQYKELIITNY